VQSRVANKVFVLACFSVAGFIDSKPAQTSVVKGTRARAHCGCGQVPGATVHGIAKEGPTSLGSGHSNERDSSSHEDYRCSSTQQIQNYDEKVNMLFSRAQIRSPRLTTYVARWFPLHHDSKRHATSASWRQRMCANEQEQYREQ